MTKQLARAMLSAAMQMEAPETALAQSLPPAARKIKRDAVKKATMQKRVPAADAARRENALKRAATRNAVKKAAAAVPMEKGRAKANERIMMRTK